MDKSVVIQEAERFMRENIPKTRIKKDGSTDTYLKHVLGGMEYALQLSEKYGADKFIVSIAALLHDVRDDAGKEHATEGAKTAREFLSRFDIRKEDKEKIIKCIEMHPGKSEANTIEEQVIQDADGIIFIEDTFKHYFEIKKEKFPVDEARKISMERVKRMMNKIRTEEGKRLANIFLAKCLDYLENAS